MHLLCSDLRVADSPVRSMIEPLIPHTPSCAEFDGECRQMVAENLGTKTTLHPGSNPVRIDKAENGEFTLVYTGSEGEASIVVDAVMMATGRTPRTAGIGLEVMF